MLHAIECHSPPPSSHRSIHPRAVTHQSRVAVGHLLRGEIDGTDRDMRRSPRGHKRRREMKHLTSVMAILLMSGGLALAQAGGGGAGGGAGAGAGARGRRGCRWRWSGSRSWWKFRRRQQVDAHSNQSKWRPERRHGRTCSGCEPEQSAGPAQSQQSARYVQARGRQSPGPEALTRIVSWDEGRSRTSSGLTFGMLGSAALISAS